MLSNCARVDFSVPQGSTIGPLLFILFINDLCDMLTYSTTVLYTDDIILYVSHDDPNEANRLMQEDKMTVNTDKSMIMLFSSKILIGRQPEPQILMGNAVLPVTTHYCYLGVELDGPLM